MAGGHGPQGNPGYIEKVELYNPVTNKFAVLRNTLIGGKTGWFIPVANSIYVKSE